MSRIVLAIAALMLLAVPAQAASLFETYKAICVDTRADSAKVEAALGPEWEAVTPPDFVQKVNPKLYRVRTLAGAKWTVTVTEQTAPARVLTR
jgi:hypothetical protein